MDGTLLNSKSLVSAKNAEAIKEASSNGVKVVLATGKTRPAAITLLNMVDLAGKDGIVSEHSPGVFIQGLLVYGKEGKEIYRSNLDPDVCKGAFHYSVEHKVPLVAFSENRCLTLFSHPLVDSLHTTYNEPKAEIMSSVEDLLGSGDVQKVLFIDTAEGVAGTLRPYWSEATKGRACVVQAQADMLEIVPPGTSKGNGVKLLLDHLGVTANEVMAIGDGENDVEMIKLASLGVALSNGSEKTKAVANVIGLSNDEDGVADAIYRLVTRPAAIALLKMVDLAGKDGIVSEHSPGVFIQVAYDNQFIGYILIRNGSEKTKAVANVIGASNDEDRIASKS